MMRWINLLKLSIMHWKISSECLFLRMKIYHSKLKKGSEELFFSGLICKTLREENHMNSNPEALNVYKYIITYFFFMQII